MSAAKKYFIDVIPLINLPRSTGPFFTYSISGASKPQPGQLVLIPFGKQKLRGIIYRIKKKVPYRRTKTIIKRLGEKPLITLLQRELIMSVAAYYGVSPAFIAKTVLPNKLSVAKQKINKIQSGAVPIKTRKTSAQYYSGTTTPQQIDAVLPAIKKTLKLKQQVLLLFPTITQLEFSYKQLSELLLGASFISMHSRLSQKIFSENYRRILTAKNTVICATRNGPLLPFINPGLVIMFDSTHAGYKQWDQKPYYHTRELINLLMKHARIRVIKTNPWPSITEWHEIQKSKQSHHSKPQWNTLKKLAVINLAHEPGPTVLSEKIEYELTARTKHERALFILNRHGTYRTLLCRDCGWQARCPTCDINLKTYDETLYCNRCETKENIPPFCPVCSGVHLKGFGVGIMTLSRRIRTLVPKENIVLYTKAEKVPYEELSTSRIVVGTDAILSTPLLPLFDRIVIVNADSEMSYPDWRSTDVFIQKVWNYLLRCTPRGTLSLQTRNADLIQKLFTQNGLTYFIQHELGLRKQYHYPPFAELVQLKYAGSSNTLYNDIVVPLAQKLTSILSNESVIAYPKPYPTKKRWVYTILIKLKPHNTTLKKKLFSFVPNEWRIDSDPLEL